MNAFDAMFWAGAVLILAYLLRSGDLRWWIPFGLVAGLGLENKISMLFLGFGVVVGLILTRDWRHFTSRWLWLGGALALLLFLPYLIWQATHDWALLEFMSRATRFKNLPLSPGDFVSAQILNMNPVVAPLALAALGFYFSRRGRPFRALGWACLAILFSDDLSARQALLLTRRHSPSSLPREVSPSRPSARGASWAGYDPPMLLLIVLSGLILAPLAKPVLPVETFVRYQASLGMAPGTDERKEVGRLSQFFADRLGWRELADERWPRSMRLAGREQPHACIFGQNYGQAGAIDFFGPDLGLPPAISGHNSYWWWGPGDCSGELVIIIGGDREDHERVFATVEKATTYTCQDCMPYENNKPIWIGRDAQVTIEELWPQLRHYD